MRTEERKDTQTLNDFFGTCQCCGARVLADLSEIVVCSDCAGFVDEDDFWEEEPTHE